MSYILHIVEYKVWFKGMSKNIIKAKEEGTSFLVFFFLIIPFPVFCFYNELFQTYKKVSRIMQPPLPIPQL